MFRLDPPAPCYAILESLRPGRSPWRFGSAKFFKGNFQVNQTLSAPGERHKGSFQVTLTSRDRAQTNSGGEAITKSPSTQACAVSSALYPRLPGGASRASALSCFCARDQAEPSVIGSRAVEFRPRQQHRSLCPGESFSLQLPSCWSQGRPRLYLWRTPYAGTNARAARAPGPPGAGRGAFLASISSSLEDATLKQTNPSRECPGSAGFILARTHCFKKSSQASLPSNWSQDNGQWGGEPESLGGRHPQFVSALGTHLKGPERVKALARDRRDCNWKPGTFGSQRPARQSSRPLEWDCERLRKRAGMRAPRAPRALLFHSCVAGGSGRAGARFPFPRVAGKRFVTPAPREDPAKSPHARRRRKVSGRRGRASPGGNSVVRGIPPAGRRGCLGARGPRLSIRGKAQIPRTSLTNDRTFPRTWSSRG